MHKMGWGIEVLSWDVCCNKRLKTWAANVGIFIRLEDYYDSITFVKGLRNSKALSLKSRQILH